MIEQFFRCNICQKRLTSDEALYNSIKVMSDSGPRLYSFCTDCRLKHAWWLFYDRENWRIFYDKEEQHESNNERDSNKDSSAKH